MTRFVMVVNMAGNDDLKVYRGEDYVINDSVKIHQCTLGEICDFGEQRYFSLIYTLTSTPTDMKYILFLNDIDWNEISDFELFMMQYTSLDMEDTQILFGDLDFSKYKIYLNQENEEPCIYNPETDSVIDKSVYELIVSYLRKSHCLKKNVERAMTETTKEVLIEEAKEQYEENLNKKYKSMLIPSISTMINMDGFNYTHETIWDIKINAFMDSVNKIQKIKKANLLLQSGYSGFGVDLNKVNKKDLNYFSGSDD